MELAHIILIIIVATREWPSYYFSTGMPHIHALLILHKDARIESPSQVDEYICARIPPLPRIEDDSIAAKQQRRLWHLVTGNMLHDCNNACLDDGKCSKHFPKQFTPNTVLSGILST